MCSKETATVMIEDVEVLSLTPVNVRIRFASGPDRLGNFGQKRAG